MRRSLATASIVFAVIACAAPDSERVERNDDSAALDAPRFEDPVEGGVLVRVVDEEGQPVAGAEVRAAVASERTATEAEQLAARSMVVEFLFASGLGQADRFGATWRTDSRGETRLPTAAGGVIVVARSADRWGVSLPDIEVVPDRFLLGDAVEPSTAPRAASAMVEDSKTLTIVLEREESIRVTCRDLDGRPSIGAFVMVAAEDPQGAGGDRTSWSDFVRASDGTLDVPHAQFWRALQAQGLEVRIVGGILWSDEAATDISRPFPDPSVSEIAFEVPSSGFVDVRADWSSPDTMGDLLWLDAPSDADEPDLHPELPINPSRPFPFSLPLGRRYEVLVELPGLIDPRVAFDGPKRPGERVEVVLTRPEPAAQITGRLVDAEGNALALHEFDAHLERDGERIEPEEEWLVSDDEGRFTLDVAPGSGGVLHVELTGSVMDAGPVFGASMRDGNESRRTARSDLARELPAGVVEVGDVVCGKPR